MSAQLAQALKSTLRIDYENDTGPGDEGFWEWWSVIDEATGETLCKCDDEATAKRILAALAAHEAAPQAQAPQDWLHLKPYGYAPGNYMSRCSDCGQTPAMDKRATRCRPCAEAAFCKTQQAPQQEPAIIVTIDDLDLVQDWAESRLPPGTHKLYAAPQQAQAPIDPDGAESRAGFRAFDESQMARWATPWQVWREAVKWAARPAQQAQAPGWQLVPVEPTREVLEALFRNERDPRAAWAEALRAAAPQQGSNT